MLNTSNSYHLDRCLINKLVEQNSDIQDLLKNLGLTVLVNNWSTFRHSHYFYNSFACYIRLFSSIESTIRKIYFYLNPNNTSERMLNYIYNNLIKTNSLNSEYKKLVDLLSLIRNLVHNMGVSTKNKTITSRNVVDFINLLDL